MTFTVIESYTDHFDRYTIDLETLDDLATLSDRFGGHQFTISMTAMTIAVDFVDAE